jgi:cyanophycin synthetase
MDLEDLEYYPTNKIEGFSDRLEKMFPGMIDHYCSENQPGGFFFRVKEGTWMGHVIEHIALEIQKLAGMKCGYGRTRSTKKKGVYNIVYNYKVEEAGIFSAHSALAIAHSLIHSQPYELEKDINKLKNIYNASRLGPSTQSIVNEAIKRGIAYKRINKQSTIQLGLGKFQRKIQATITDQTSSIGVDLACNKEKTKLVLDKMGIPVPKGSVVHNFAELKLSIDSIGYPIVLKPNNGNQGKGATTNIKNWEQAVEAYDLASRYSPVTIVESYISGNDFRVLVINHKFVAAAKRTPALVIGDGNSSIKQLIDKTNEDPRRGNEHENTLTKIIIDEPLLKLLSDSGLDLDSVPTAGQTIFLKTTANLSTGGTAENVTESVHPFNQLLAERVSRIMNLDICGIDIIAHDLKTPINVSGGAVIEVNAAPGFRMHLAPTVGKPVNVAAPVLDMLFPEGKSSRMPIIAITGTNGKTTTTRLLAHMAKTAGFNVGYTTSDGVYINDELIFEGDCTGPKSTEMVINDPSVDFAVLECARGGIVKSGLAFSNCDIGIVTNVTSDHLGLHDIHTLEELALVKSVIPESVHKKGYAILNADDDLTYKMAQYVKGRVVLFSMDKGNPRLIKHCGNGGFAAYLDNGNIYIRRGASKRKILHVDEIPLTFSGKATFMIENILPVVIAGYLSYFHIEDIRDSLKSFIPSPKQTPGRMNLFQFINFELLVDYAHNPAGLRAIGKFLKNVEAHPKVGVIAGVGDRRDEDIIEVGYTAANIFDEIIIRNDKTLRGRQAEDLNALLLTGIRKKRPDLAPQIIQNEELALKYILKNAKEGSFIVFCTEKVLQTLNLIEKFQKEESRYVLEKENF